MAVVARIFPFQALAANGTFANKLRQRLRGVTNAQRNQLSIRVCLGKSFTLLGNVDKQVAGLQLAGDVCGRLLAWWGWCKAGLGEKLFKL